MPYTNEYVDREFTAPFGAIAAGRLGRPKVVARGGQKHIVEIVFTDRPQVGDTITVNGVTWTFIANGGTPSGNEIALGLTTLADDLDAIIAALNGSADADVAEFTYTEDGVDTLTATADADGIYAVTAFDASITAGSTVTVADSGVPTRVIGVDDSWAVQFDTGDVTQAQGFSLPDGKEAQMMVIAANADAPGGDFVVTPANINGGTALTFDAAGEFAFLMFIGGAWNVLSASAGVLA